jgi:hypothetical protein
MTDVIVIWGFFLPSKTHVRILVHPEPVTSPVVPHFPHRPNFRGHNFRKTRNRAGIIQRFPTGTDEVEYSNVTETESKMGCGLGYSGHRRPGDIPASPSGSVRDKEKMPQNAPIHSGQYSSLKSQKEPNLTFLKRVL